MYKSNIIKLIFPELLVIDGRNLDFLFPKALHNDSKYYRIYYTHTIFITPGPKPNFIRFFRIGA